MSQCPTCGVNKEATLTSIQRLRAELAEAKADAESWAEQADQRTKNAVQFIEERDRLRAELASLRVAAQRVTQAHDDGTDMQGPIDRLTMALDAALAKGKP